MMLLYIILAFLCGLLVGLNYESKRSTKEYLDMFCKMNSLAAEKDRLECEIEVLKNGYKYTSKEEKE